MSEDIAPHERIVEEQVTIVVESTTAAADLSQEEDEDRYKDYVPGYRTPNGDTVKSIIGKHRRFVVYRTTRNQIAWDYHHLPQHLRPAVAEFQRINGLALSILPHRYHLRISTLLGPALYSALLSATGVNIGDHFEASRAYISQRGTELARFMYVLLSAVGAVVCLGLCLDLELIVYVLANAQWFQIIGLCACGGVIGSLVSIIQRSHDLQVDPLASWLHIGFQGALRITLGFFFGAIIAIASQANIAFGKIAHDSYALFLVAIAAGFSERLVPDIIERAASTNS